MTKRKRRRYDDEFRASAVLMLEAAGYPDREGALLYGIYRKGDSTPFYIGSTKYDELSRFDSHIAAVKKGNHANKHFMRKVKKLGYNNVEVRVIYRVSEKDRFYAERDLIKYSVDSGIKLTNKIYNGVNFEIEDARWDYLQYRWTPEKQAAFLAIKEPPKARNPEHQPIMDKLWDALLVSIKVLVDIHREKTERDFPGLIEWYNGISKIHG